jgi:hypothetical protein
VKKKTQSIVYCSRRSPVRWGRKEEYQRKKRKKKMMKS